MLVLTRKQGEQIRIGNDVVITVVRTKGKAVRLGIQAPAAISVLRGELLADESADDDGKPQPSTTVRLNKRNDRPGASEQWPTAASQPARRTYPEQAALSKDAVEAGGPGPLRVMMNKQL